MTRYFVYYDVDYYPYAEVVEAESREEVVKRNERDLATSHFGLVVTELENVDLHGGCTDWEASHDC